ncbi:hypothetical protein DYH55_20565 [Methylovirgula sp. 4M-Z18]|nr:hypothetical protein DYH55_20565 [Methylovirgula sp. 4M-Z18]
MASDLCLRWLRGQDLLSTCDVSAFLARCGIFGGRKVVSGFFGVPLRDGGLANLLQDFRATI